MSRLYHVYVLQNPAGRYYIGLSEDLEHRLAQHNAGESKWTAKHHPCTMAWNSDALNLTEARKFENLLKRQKGGRGFYQLTGLAPSGS